MCRALRRVAFPPTLAALGAGAFTACAALEELRLAHTQLAAVPRDVCRDCFALRDVTLPPTVVCVDELAFAGTKFWTADWPRHAPGNCDGAIET
jgi:hypothetical protein